MPRKKKTVEDLARELPSVAPAEIGRRLEVAREALGIETQKEFLKDVGMSQQVYSNMLAGKSVPTVFQVFAFSERYELPTDFILRGQTGEIRPYWLQDDIAARLNAMGRKNAPKRRS